MSHRWLIASVPLLAVIALATCHHSAAPMADTSSIPMSEPSVAPQTAPALTAVVAPPAAAQAPSLPANSTATISPAELRSVLAELARAHDQKTQLAWYVSTPLRSVDPALKPFYSKMGDQQKELLSQLRAWAKDHKVDLAYSPPSDTIGQAQKIVEARQEKLVRGDNRQDFQRDNLMQMFNDYEWQIAQLQAVLPKVKDPTLKAYMQKSLKVHEDGSAEILALLKRFKFNG